MAYSRNFGMRSFENVVRDGRFRAPASGTQLRIGQPVQLDSDNPGFVKQADEAAAPGPACGLAVFEHIQNKSDALTTSSDSPHDKVPFGQYVQVLHGPGTKVWLQNTPDKVLYDGRVQEAAGLLCQSVDVENLAVGAGLVPHSDGNFREAAEDEAAWLVVEQVNTSTGRVEARLTF